MTLITHVYHALRVLETQEFRLDPYAPIDTGRPRINVPFENSHVPRMVQIFLNNAASLTRDSHCIIPTGLNLQFIVSITSPPRIDPERLSALKTASDLFVQTLSLPWQEHPISDLPREVDCYTFERDVPKMLSKDFPNHVFFSHKAGIDTDTLYRAIDRIIDETNHQRYRSDNIRITSKNGTDYIIGLRDDVIACIESIFKEFVYQTPSLRTLCLEKMRESQFPENCLPGDIEEVLTLQPIRHPTDAEAFVGRLLVSRFSLNGSNQFAFIERLGVIERDITRTIPQYRLYALDRPREFSISMRSLEKTLYVRFATEDEQSAVREALISGQSKWPSDKTFLMESVEGA